MQISYNQLTELTGISYRVLKKKLDGMVPVGTGRNGAKLWDSIEALNRIYAHSIIENVSGGNGNENQINVADEKALLAKEQRVHQQLKNARQRGELIPVQKVKEMWGRIITSAKQQFLALPDRLVQILEATETPQEQRILIDQEIKSILFGLSMPAESYREREQIESPKISEKEEMEKRQQKLF